MVINNKNWKDKTVLVTGHTGFKGGWLTLLLTELVAEVHGVALPPQGERSFFADSNLSSVIKTSNIVNITDLHNLKKVVSKVQPDFIFHLAAQPLVRYSYENPIETFQTNVLGTVNILEASRSLNSLDGVVVITTDKVYSNKEWEWGYRENDPLGGSDPYSASKACSEFVVDSYRESYFRRSNTAIVTVRAGNVIGGGDWALDRLIPDAIRAIENNISMTIRAPDAIRPWQHVLSPLEGYIILAQQMMAKKIISGAWNFGPPEWGNATVKDVLKIVKEVVPDFSYQVDSPHNLHEAKILALDSSKANYRLGWSHRWNLEEAIRKTIEWHMAQNKKSDMEQFSRLQIKRYLRNI